MLYHRIWVIDSFLLIITAHTELLWTVYVLFYSCLQLFGATKDFMKTVSKLVMQDANMSLTADQIEAKASEFANDVFNFELQVANVSLGFMKWLRIVCM